jgi:MFS superfamily sulfate permease-like transporter
MKTEPEMINSLEPKGGPTWLRRFPPARWLADYRSAWLRGDIVAGVTLAAYAIPVSLAYAGLAGLPPQVGVYGYLLGGLGYALLGSSRQLAIGPTSAISLMIAGTVGAMADGTRNAMRRSRASRPSPWPCFACSPGCCG